MRPLISVIIPIYNTEAYLARCLDSVLNNTYQNIEVICVDDGSKDSSAEILRAYAEKDSRIVSIIKENGGVSSARNAGLDRMTGEYVCFIDSDDCIHLQCFELLYYALRENATEISMCEFGQELPVQPEELSFEALSVQTCSFSQIFGQLRLCSSSCARLILAALTSDVRFREDLDYGEDTLFFSDVCARASSQKAAVISHPLYYYLHRNDSATAEVTSSRQLNFTRAMAQKLLQPEGRDDIYLLYLLKWCLRFRYISTYVYPERAVAGEWNTVLKDIQGRVRKTNELSKSRKAAFLLMIDIPVVYRVFRIINDPSLLRWEKAKGNRFRTNCQDEKSADVKFSKR